MSYTIKNNISFDEYNAIINKVIEDCFVDGVYSPALYELSLRVSLISAFVPAYDLSDCKDNNALWKRVTSEECKDILDEIMYETMECNNICVAIKNGINHRLRAIEASPMSLSDIALSKLIGVVTEKIDSIDNEILNSDTISALINAEKQTNKEDFEAKLVDEMIARDLISKPNRATRRKSTKNNKNITVKKNVVPVNTESESNSDTDK